MRCPALTGHDEDARESQVGLWAFWLQIGGMFGMTMAFAAAGITQTYLERILGLGYLETQPKIQVHFLMLVGTGLAVRRSASALFLWDFFFLRRPGEPATGRVAGRGRGGMT